MRFDACTAEGQSLLAKLLSGPESWVAMPSKTGLQGRGYEFLILKPGKRPMEKGFLRVVHFSLNDRYSL
jgi:hypothetical protein